MACPLFIPTTRLTGFSVPGLADLQAPLGDLYNGSCAAEPTTNIDPDILGHYCNFGRARAHCPRAEQSDADAVRFLVKGEKDGTVQVAWAVERDHHPVAVGVAEVRTDETAAPVNVLDAQIRACAHAYLRNRPAAPTFPGPAATSEHP